MIIARKKGQYIVIGNQIIVAISDINYRTKQAVLAIRAPREIAIVRCEELDNIDQEPLDAISKAKTGEKPISD